MCIKSKTKQCLCKIYDQILKYLDLVHLHLLLNILQCKINSLPQKTGFTKCIIHFKGLVALV